MPSSRLCAAVVLTLMLLVACGGGETTGADTSDAPSADAAASEAGEAAEGGEPTKDEWIDQVITSCETFNAALNENEPEGDPFAEGASDEDREKALLYLQAATDGLAQWAADLRDLGIPAEDSEAAQAIIDSAEASSAAFAEAVSAAEEDFPASQQVITEAFGSFGALQSAAQAYGIADLEDCAEEAPPTEGTS